MNQNISFENLYNDYFIEHKKIIDSYKINKTYENTGDMKNTLTKLKLLHISFCLVKQSILEFVDNITDISLEPNTYNKYKYYLQNLYNTCYSHLNEKYLNNSLFNLVFISDNLDNNIALPDYNDIISSDNNIIFTIPGISMLLDKQSLILKLILVDRIHKNKIAKYTYLLSPSIIKDQKLNKKIFKETLLNISNYKENKNIKINKILLYLNNKIKSIKSISCDYSLEL